MEERMRQEVQYLGGIGSLESSRARLAAWLLAWDYNPWRTRPRSCRVRDASGERDVALAWRDISLDQFEPLATRATFGDASRDYRITHPRPDVAWITVPSFAENVGQNRAGLESLVRGLPAARDKRLIVFDVRGNRGGNSFWGQQLLTALFGTDYIAQVATMVTAPQFVQWRASTENADFVEQSTLKRYQPGSPSHAALSQTIRAMRDAIAVGRPLSAPNAPAAQSSSSPTHDLGTRVVLLTDGWCASACLDFVDLLLTIPGVRHAGAATYADAIYIDNRSVRLPSDLGWFGFSMKVYRNRRRGHNEPYVPTLVYSGTTWDTTALQAWLLTVAR
jgi:hypothetical protein